MQGLVAKKIGMTRVVDQNGTMIPVTLLKVEDQVVTKVVSPEKEGYNAVQVGYRVKRENRLTKADVTRLRKANISENFTSFKEFRLTAPATLTAGTKLSLDLIDGISLVDIMGITKGRGFEGAIRRWNHARGRMTHGSDFHRRPGSLGCRTTPGRVMKGKEVPGHWGVDNCTIKNLVVVDVDKEANTIAIKGSVPGHRDGFVFLTPAKGSGHSTQAAK